jgi:hypothetical protein
MKPMNLHQNRAPTSPHAALTVFVSNIMNGLPAARAMFVLFRYGCTILCPDVCER